MAEDCGLNGVALHARTREQGYAGNARWEWIAAVKDRLRFPWSATAIFARRRSIAMVAETGCDE